MLASRPDTLFRAFGGRLLFRFQRRDNASWRDAVLPDSLEAFQTWDGAQRRRQGLWRTIRWFPKHIASDRKTRTIASLHWHHLTCWSWFVESSWIAREFAGFKLIIGPRQKALVLWRWQISYHAQDEGFSVSDPYREKAPKIIWQQDVM